MIHKSAYEAVRHETFLLRVEMVGGKAQELGESVERDIPRIKIAGEAYVRCISLLNNFRFTRKSCDRSLRHKSGRGKKRDHDQLEIDCRQAHVIQIKKQTHSNQGFQQVFTYHRSKNLL